MPLILRSGLLCIPFLLCIGHLAYPQTAASPSDVSVGTIRLQVNDPSGAGLRASGSLTGPGTKRRFQTDVQGAFSLTGLAFGEYELQISRSGFVSRKFTVQVNSAAPDSLEVTLVVQGTSTNITVISPTPIGQATQSLDEIPVPVQGLTAKDFEDTNALDLADLMNRRLTSVYINENAGNPFQPDINYRGYTASPLLGTPEGLSVYLDGVRQNQPFGDIVAWDLIPKVAIRDMALIPGSDPIYGLNTLGGAVAVQTKRRPHLVWRVTAAHRWQVRSPRRRRRVGRRIAQRLQLLPGGQSLSRRRMAAIFSVRGPAGFRQAGLDGCQDKRVPKRRLCRQLDDRQRHFRLPIPEANYTAVNSIPDVTWDHSPSLTLNVNHAVD